MTLHADIEPGALIHNINALRLRGGDLSGALPLLSTDNLLFDTDVVEGVDDQLVYALQAGGNAHRGATTSPDTDDPTWNSEGLLCDGVDDHITIPSFGKSSAYPWTMHFCFTPEVAGGTQRLMDTNNTGGRITPFHDAATDTFVELGASSGGLGINLPVGTPVLWTIVHEAGGDCRGYLDGVDKGTLFTGAALAQFDAEMIIAARFNRTLNVNLTIHFMAFYDDERIAVEVAADYAVIKARVLANHAITI